MLQIIGLLTLVSVAASLAPTCGIINEDGSKPIILPAVNESQAGGVVLGEFPLFNVRYTGPMSEPYRRYVRVLLHNPLYSIESTNLFPKFVQTERSQTLTGDAPFYCKDGSNITYTFRIPVKDENTEKPYFNASSYRVNVTFTGSGEDITIDAGVNVFDEDLNELNSIIQINSSDVRFQTRSLRVANRTAFQYEINLVVRDEVNMGHPQITLDVGDGKYTAKAVVILNVIEVPDGLNNNTNLIRRKSDLHDKYPYRNQRGLQDTISVV